MKCLLALLLMGGGSMMAQNKLAPMVSSYVQQAKTRRAAAAGEQKPGLFMVRVHYCPRKSINNSLKRPSALRF